MLPGRPCTPSLRICLRLMRLKMASVSFFFPADSMIIFSNILSMKQDYAEYLTKKTKEDYDKIAGDFSRTRAYLWDDLRRFAALVKEGDSLLDFGCGNGRLFELFGDIKGIHYTGIDHACQLIEKAREKHAGAEFICSYSEKLPFPNEYFNIIFAVASLHHIPSERKRLELLAEFKRTLKPGGGIVVVVWHLWQTKYNGLFLPH